MKRTRVANRAEELVVSLGIDSPPVPVEEIAVALGVKVLERPLEEDVSGIIFNRKERPFIVINSAHAPTRRRFSLAHELGHFILHGKNEMFIDTVLRRDKKAALGVDSREIEANQFAAELLMPREWIVRAANEARHRKLVLDEDALVRSLAKRFDVSPEALRFRLVNLGILGTS